MTRVTRERTEQTGSSMAEAVQSQQVQFHLGVIADAFTEIGERVKAATMGSAFQAIVDVALHHVPGTAAASMTTVNDVTFRTVAASSEIARQADQIQYELGTGPCVDAILDRTIYRPRDLTTDPRWPEYGRRVAALGLRSMLSYRMDIGPALIGGLNIYSDQVDAFDDGAATIGLFLATHGAIAASAVAERTKAEQLEHALASNRKIGMAVGILMARHKVTETQAFDLLRIASQNTHRKLRDVAGDVVDHGTLDVAPPLRDT
ncbi:GAF and ANTAR domain-containing protein [Terrabacter sp. GCM10028922]|uniref:GAF and ANTAR domain-containing protein n=1 Tax=Terrabacter sp. GCM10028922 TaxID=3273428 RepID=UPI003614ECDD